jgi:O-antigen/teichoic acid export membrane protein
MFFLWQVLISVLAVFIFRYLAFNILPKQMQSGSFSIQTLLAAKQYVGAMYSLSVLGIILSQFDKIVLSFSIEMSSFGYYTVASTVAALLFNLAAPITNAFFPRLCELKETGETLEFSDAFHKGAQLVSIVCGTGSFCLLIYSNEILFLWLGDKNVVEDISPLLKLLVIGNLINVVTWIPYQTQYAHGWTSLALKTNLIAIVVFIPTAIVFVLNFGAKGVIVSWIGLNIYYLFLSIPFMFSRILKGEAFKFYMSSILFPLGAGFFTMMLSSLFFDFESGVTGIMFKILICTTLSLVTSFLASGNVLTDAIKVARGVKG